jgi:CRISPR system Cascade subunit CasA
LGLFRLLTYPGLLCRDGTWQVSLPRDDLELACVQLLVCMTQVMFLPEDDGTLRARLGAPLTPEEFADGVAPCAQWFDLDHPTQPFMQSRGVKGEWTSVQKLLPGLPEQTSSSASAHCFFNEVSEVRRIAGPVAAIALFNQASNSPSFGGGFKGSLRGGAPITTLVAGSNLRDTVWRNVLTLPRVRQRLPGYDVDFTRDQPTWVRPIERQETVRWNEIGLVRGLFWQPARVELLGADAVSSCDVLGIEQQPVYAGFRKEKFGFTVAGLWPHPHGAMTAGTKNGALEWKFAGFTTTAPAWTLLTEFVVPRSVDAPDAKEGSSPAGPVDQAADIFEGRLHLLVGGYRVKQAAVEERRHELMSLAQGWNDDKNRRRLETLVDLGKKAKSALRGRLYLAVKGDKNKGLKGIGADIHETGERLFYARTEALIHETFDNSKTFQEWQAAKAEFVLALAGTCRSIFEELTRPYALKPELIPVIAWARWSLNAELAKLTKETTI